MNYNIVDELRIAAKEIRIDNHSGWGDTCDWAADALELADKRIAELELERMMFKSEYCDNHDWWKNKIANSGEDD